MLAWLMNNLINIVICVVLVMVMGGIVLHMIRNRRTGKTSCGCGCDGCSACAAGCATQSTSSECRRPD